MMQMRKRKKKKNEEEDLSLKTPETRRILRIADILLVDEMEKSRKSADRLTVIQCSTPRRVVSRWLSAIKLTRHSRTHKTDHNKTRANLPKRDGGSGGCGVDSSSFNLGVACGLLCVVAAGKNELNKMVKMRTEMELILENAKRELGSKNAVIDNSKLAESNEINCTSFSTNFQQASTSGSQFSLQSVAVRDECSDCVGNEGEGDEYVAGMDQLEEELHAELERLQLHLDSETNLSISKSPQQQRLKVIGDIGSNRAGVDSTSTDYSDEMLWGSGVCPLELERKLHQVLEARQEERIKELEDALECAAQKLEEKEIGVSWWRDTARLVSGHDSYPLG